MHLDEFKEYLNSKNHEATILLESLTSEADRLDELEHQIENMDDYEHFLKAAKAITDDSQGDIDHINVISDEIFNHSNRDEFYSDCYMEFLKINFTLKCCACQATRIEDTTRHIVNKYGIILQHVHGMEFVKIVAIVPNFNDVIEFIAECNGEKNNQIVTPEDKELMIEKEVEDLDIPNGYDYEHDHVIGIVDGREDLPKHPYINDIHQVYVSYDKDTNTVTTWYFDHLLMDWHGEPWKLKGTTFEDYVQSVKVETQYTPNGLEIFGLVRKLDDLPIHNKYKGTIWAVRNGCDAEFNPMYIYYEWNEAEDGTPFYCGFTGDLSLYYGETIIHIVSWNGFEWVDSACYNYRTCQFIDVVTSFNQLDDLDISEANSARKTPVAVLLLDHEDGNSTIEPFVYNNGTKKWVRGFPIVNTTDTKSTKACTEEFVHDWKEAHNK